jgi:hypothetical protein
MTKRNQKMKKRAARNLDERAKYHFGREDIWSFFTVNAAAQVRALKTLRDEAHGYPNCFNSMEEWKDALTTMINGWQAIIDQDEMEWSLTYYADWEALQERFKKGMEVYVELYQHLWD